MTFIGFLADKKNEDFFYNALKIYFNNINVEVVIIAINERCIDNIKNIKFDTVIIDYKIKEKIQDELIVLLKNAKNLIINADVAETGKLKDVDLMVITYGFGSKCTITASSVLDENTIICLQRSIKNIHGKIIEPMELSITDKTKNQYLQMVLGTLKILYE